MFVIALLLGFWGVLQTTSIQYKNDSTLNAPENLRMKSKMLAHTLLWDAAQNISAELNYTVYYSVYDEWAELEDEIDWFAESNCINITTTSCELYDLDWSTISYLVTVEAVNKRGIRSSRPTPIKFIPEYHTELTPPSFKLQRHDGLIFVQPIKPMNAQTSEELSVDMASLHYQMRIWEKGHPDDSETVLIHLTKSEYSFKASQEIYCVQVRLYAEEYDIRDVATGDAEWSPTQCTAEVRTSNGKIILIFFVVAISIATFAVLVCCAVKGERIRRFVKKVKPPPAHLVELVRRETKAAENHTPRVEQIEHVDTINENAFYYHCESEKQRTGKYESEQHARNLISATLGEVSMDCNMNNITFNRSSFDEQPFLRTNIDNLAYMSNPHQETPDIINTDL